MSLSDDENAQTTGADAASDLFDEKADDTGADVGEEEEVRDATVEDLFGDEDEATGNEAPVADVTMSERQSSAAPSQNESDGDGLTEAERKHRKNMEYEEEEGESAEPQILREAEINIPKLPLPTSSDSQYWMMRLPSFLKLDTKPFHTETYEGPQDEYEGEDKKESAIMLDVTNTIRWRWIQGEDGEMKKQSNARIVKWSDGSMSLQLGTELFDINANAEGSRPVPAASQLQTQSQTQSSQAPKRAGGLSYLYTQHKHAGVLQCEVPITGTLTLQPTGMFSATHRQLVRAVGQRHSRTARLRLAPEPTMDPEREQRELQKTANRSARPRKPRASMGGFDGARRSRTSTASRRRDDVFASDDSGGDVNSDSDDGIGARKKTQSAPKRGGEYVADDFVVSDEDDADDGGSPNGKRRKGHDDGMDSLDEAEEKLEREAAKRRKKERASGKEDADLDPEADADEDVDMDDSAEDEEASIRKAGGNANAMIVDDPRSLDDANRAEPTETSSLLAEHDEAQPTQRFSRSRIMRFQRAHLALPVAFLGFMSGSIAVTTSIQIVNIIACQLWYNAHDPSKVPPSGHIPEELCQAPEVQSLFARIIQILIIVDICGAVVTSSPIGTLSAKFGRKPIFIIIALLYAISPLVIIAALYQGSLVLVVFSTVIAAIGGPRQLSLLTTMFIVDVSSDPGPVLSILEGSVNFGLAISFALGGLITRWSGSLTYVFWVQAAICTVLLFYIIIAIPESFGWEKRTARAAEVAAERSRGRQRSSRPRLARSRSTSLERVQEGVKESASAFSRPLALIWPKRDPATGKRNKRMMLLSVGVLLAYIGSAYSSAAYLIYTTNRFHATPDQNGYMLSSVAAGKTIYLLLLFPPILKTGHRFYFKNYSNRTDTKSSPSSLFDVHLLAFSLFVTSLALLGIGLSPNRTLASISLMIEVLGSGAAPCISALVSASVEPLVQGEALAAIALVRSTAEFLSPIILGSILSRTATTRLPQLVFFVSSIFLLLAVGIITLVRDTDKYTPPDNTSSNDPNPGTEE
ncbi:Leo1-like protein, partial [Rhizoctonia solani]